MDFLCSRKVAFPESLTRGTIKKDVFLQLYFITCQNLFIVLKPGKESTTIKGVRFKRLNQEIFNIPRLPFKVY